MTGSLENGVKLVVDAAGDRSELLVKVSDGKDLVFVIGDGESVELSSPLNRTECEEDSGSGVQTPTGSIFDPFAPCAEDVVAFAPIKKPVKIVKVHLRRQLDFESCVENSEDGGDGDGDDDDDKEEDQFIKGVRKSFLDLIISTQLSEMPKEELLGEADPSDVLKTPANVPFLTGIAETCPDAPMRSKLILRRLTDGICRKLEFGTDTV